MSSAAARSTGTSSALRRDVLDGLRAAARDDGDRLGRGRLVGRRLRPARRGRTSSSRTRCTTATPAAPRRSRACSSASRRASSTSAPGSSCCRSTRSSSSRRWPPSGDPALEAADDAAPDPRPASTTGSAAARRPSSRTRRRRSASTRQPGAGRPTCSSGSTCRRRSFPEIVAPGTPLGRSRPTSPRRRGSARRAVSRSRRTTPARPSRRCRSGEPARRSSASARGRSSASRSTRPVIDDATFARQPDERGRRRGHVPAAPQRHRSLAAARVPARGPPRARELSFDDLVALARTAAAAALVHRPERPRLRRARRHAGAHPRVLPRHRPARAGRRRRDRPLHPREPRAEARRDGRPARRGHRLDPERAPRRRRRRPQRAALRAGRPRPPACRCSPVPTRRR